jgi:hypothetical protein
VTRKSVDEYLKAIKGRYLKGTKEEKGKILDEFTKVTGIHRKEAIRLLNGKKSKNHLGVIGQAVFQTSPAFYGGDDQHTPKS